jgi:hypothetical protein
LLYALLLTKDETVKSDLPCFFFFASLINFFIYILLNRRCRFQRWCSVKLEADNLRFSCLLNYWASTPWDFTLPVIWCPSLKVEMSWFSGGTLRSYCSAWALDGQRSRRPWLIDS